MTKKEKRLGAVGLLLLLLYFWRNKNRDNVSVNLTVNDDRFPSLAGDVVTSIGTNVWPPSTD